MVDLVAEGTELTFEKIRFDKRIIFEEGGEVLYEFVINCGCPSLEFNVLVHPYKDGSLVLGANCRACAKGIKKCLPSKPAMMVGRLRQISFNIQLEPIVEDDDQPREYTAKECQRMLFEHLVMTIFEWSKSTIPSSTLKPGDETIAKMENLVFSIFCIFDGVSSGSPPWLLVPDSSPENQDFAKDTGDNWWPCNEEAAGLVDGEISCGDMLHDQWFEFLKNR